MENENRKINKCIMQGWTGICMVLFLAYMLEVVKGNRTSLYFAIFSILTVGPVIFSWIAYKRNPESRCIKYLCAGFYGLLYVFVLMTGSTPMVFCYFIPIVCLLIICNDQKLLYLVGIGNIIANIASIVVQIVVDKRTPAEYMTEWEIQIAATVLCSIFSCMAIRVSTELNHDKVQTVVKGEKQRKEVFEKVTEVTGAVEKDTSEILEKLIGLREASEKTAATIDGIVSGATQSAEMVERQMSETSNIQEIIDHTNQVSEDTVRNVEETARRLRAGIDNMKKLSDSAKGVEENSSYVVEQMSQLSITTEKVQDIILIINGIASQTNLLALNASIEAARAGTAGAGFAVVADEINALANQTKEATQNIAQMVNTLWGKAAEASAAVHKMEELNKLQNNIIFETEETFGQIRDGVEEVKENTEEERRQMEKLMSANMEIVESIHTISAVTQEVTANISQTQEITTNNNMLVNDVSVLAQKLENKVSELKSYV